MTDPLGPFQGFWEAWDEVDEEIRTKPLGHLGRAAEIQFEELSEHLANGDRRVAAREAVDVISIALNTLRRLGYQPDEIAEIARERATSRMRGILDKYQVVYGI